MHTIGRVATDGMPKVGEVVLIGDEGVTRNCWRLGRVMSLVKSNDGLIRSAKLMTANKRVINRPICLLYPLEVNQ